MPNAPRIFLEAETPAVDVQLEVSDSTVIEGVHEVVVAPAHLAGGRRVEPAEDVQQCRLPRPGPSDHRQELAGVRLQVDRRQRVYDLGARPESPAHPLCPHQRLGLRPGLALLVGRLVGRVVQDQIQCPLHPVRDDVPRLLHHHPVADPHVLLLDQVLVVQRRLRHRRPREADRLERRHHRAGRGHRLHRHRRRAFRRPLQSRGTGRGGLSHAGPAGPAAARAPNRRSACGRRSAGRAARRCSSARGSRPRRSSTPAPSSTGSTPCPMPTSRSGGCATA